MVKSRSRPLDPRAKYKGLRALSRLEQRRSNVDSLAAWCEIGRAHGVKFFREALTGTPLH